MSVTDSGDHDKVEEYACAIGKLTFTEFESRLWGERYSDIPLSTRREFYADYVNSGMRIDVYEQVIGGERT